jgi:hypothetical protein
MRRHLPGTFLAHHLNDGAWRLSRGEPAPIDVFMSGAEAAAGETFRLQKVRDIDIEWRAGAVVMTMTAAEQPRTVRMQSTIVHEPQARLYASLPLADLDADTRRLWRRIFGLARVPGGRYLLRLLARRTRNRR